MNIHGLKLKSKNITRILKRELSKKKRFQNYIKVRRLMEAKRNCNNQIRALKAKDLTEREKRKAKSFKKGG